MRARRPEVAVVNGYAGPIARLYYHSRTYITAAPAGADVYMVRRTVYAYDCRRSVSRVTAVTPPRI